MFDPSKKHGTQVELRHTGRGTLRVVRLNALNFPHPIPSGHNHCSECGVWIDTEHPVCRRCHQAIVDGLADVPYTQISRLINNLRG